MTTKINLLMQKDFPYKTVTTYKQDCNNFDANM